MNRLQSIGKVTELYSAISRYLAVNCSLSTGGIAPKTTNLKEILDLTTGQQGTIR